MDDGIVVEPLSPIDGDDDDDLSGMSEESFEELSTAGDINGEDISFVDDAEVNSDIKIETVQ